LLVPPIFSLSISLIEKAIFHINPVKHGYVKRAADWPYSSIHRERFGCHTQLQARALQMNAEAYESKPTQDTADAYRHLNQTREVAGQHPIPMPDQQPSGLQSP
jgi:hypothetical protein